MFTPLNNSFDHFPGLGKPQRQDSLNALCASFNPGLVPWDTLAVGQGCAEQPHLYWSHGTSSLELTLK